MAENGIITRPSRFGPAETMNRLADGVAARGLTVFARIDHAAAAGRAGLPLRPTELLIFGDAGQGTPLMQAAQQFGIDLPLKGLVWQDAGGTTWLSCNDLGWLAGRHGVADETERAVAALAAGLDALVAAAVGAPPPETTPAAAPSGAGPAEARLDEALEESFPASDPPGVSTVD